MASSTVVEMETCEENGLTAAPEGAGGDTDALEPAVLAGSGSTPTAAAGAEAAEGLSLEMYSNSSASTLCECRDSDSSSADHGTASICSSPSGSDLEAMPQWKKDLLQRRKTNVARTLGACQASGCSKKGLDPVLIPTSPVMPLTKTLTGTSISSSSNNTIKSNTSHSINVKMPALIHHTSISGHYTPLNSSSNISGSSSSSQQPIPPQQQTAAQVVTPPITTTTATTNIHTSQEQQSSGTSSSNNPKLWGVGSSSSISSNSSSTTSNSTTITAAATEESSGKCNGSSASTTSGTCLTTSQQQLPHCGADLALQQQQQPPFQLHSRLDVEKSPSSPSSLSSSCGSASSGPLLNSFIKNPSANKSSKTNKYKSTNTKVSNNNPSALSSVNNSSATTTTATTITSTKKMVAAQDINENAANLEFDFDPSEELQYGPGIVSKLRCRYLSLALRQSAGKQRPPLDNLRRATSLNNLLDDDDDSHSSSCITDHHHHHVDGISQKIWQNTTTTAGNATSAPRTPDEFVATFQKNLKISENDKQRSRQIKRGNDSLKRARSVEALLVSDKSWADNITTTTTQSTNGTHQTRSMYKKIISQKDDTSSAGIGSDMSSLTSAADVTIEDKITNARERIHLNDKPPKRLTSIIDDTERPPPDLVKQTLKIFEATANRRGRGLSRNNFSGEVAAKVANYKSIISQEKPPIVFPKPPLSPKKHFRTKPTNLDIAAAKKTSQQHQQQQQQQLASKKTHPTSPISNLAKKFAGCDIATSEQQPLSPTSSSSPGSLLMGYRTTTTTTDNSSFRNSVKNDSVLSRNNSYDNVVVPRTPDVVPRKHFENSCTVDSPITQVLKKMEKLNIESPHINTSTPIQSNAPPSYRQTSESSEDSIDDDDLSKRVSKLALENISKAGTTQHFSFNKTPPSGKSGAVNGNASGYTTSSDQQQQQQQNPTIATPSPLTTTTTTAKQVGIIRPLVSESKLQTGKPKHMDIDCSIEEISAKTRDNLVISNLSQSNTTTSISPSPILRASSLSPTERPALTSREIEKNLINEKKSAEQANLESGGGGGPKWQLGRKKPWNSQAPPSQNNSMVFNFKDRKEVPDYIENDGLPFKRRRELPKPNESGFVLLGDLSLETSTDPDDSWMMGPPSPCNVEFENANIIIDGKSSIRNQSRDISLRVQFDDALTSTYEYPSESSLLEDVTSSENSSNNKDPAEHRAEHVAVEEIIQLPPGPKLLGNVSLGSAPLASYTPIKAQINTNFELGVTRAPTILTSASSEINVQNTTTNGSSSDSELNSSKMNGGGGGGMDLITTNGSATTTTTTEPDSLPYLKPASDDLTVAYSEGTQKTDLLY